MDKWKTIKPENLALICDEAHNIGAKTTRRIMELDPQYRIGLSATPARNFDEEGSELILNYFNYQKYEFSIRDAQREHYLVEYEYRILPILMDDGDWQDYIQTTQKISKRQYSLKNESINSAKRNNIEERIEKLYRDRADLIKKSDGKIEMFDSIFAELPPESRILIYGEDLPQLQKFQKKLKSLGQPFLNISVIKTPKRPGPLCSSNLRRALERFYLLLDAWMRGSISPPVTLPSLSVRRHQNASLYRGEGVYCERHLVSKRHGFMIS